MPRRVEDILPNNHRSIRSIEVEKPGEIQIKKSASNPAPKKAPPRISIAPPAMTSRRRGRRTAFILIIVGIIVVVAGAGYIASAYFSKATFTLVPKTLPVTVNGTYIATNGSAASTPSGNISYELITVKGTASTTVAATDGAFVTSKASGKVTLYNAYSADSAKLIAGTRLSDDTGRIYRLTSTVVIPGFTKPGVSIVPGSIVASIAADQAGPSYNISRSDSISDFKIVAYAGTPKYDAMYARLTSDVAGGKTGTQKIVSPSLLASTSENVRASLANSLKEQVMRTVPDGYVMYDKGFLTSFSAPSTGGTDGSRAVLTISGTGYGVIFKKSDLVRTVVGDKNVSQFGDFAYTSPGLESLVFSVANPKDFSPEKKNNLIMHLSGDMKLVGTIPVDDLKARLAGSALSSTQDVLKRYKEVIESGSGELVPPWTTVPKDLSRISVVIKDK